MKKITLFLYFVSALSFFSCQNGSTGQEMIEYPLFAKGENVTDFVSKDGWNIHLTSAKLIFGPLKLCAHVPTFQYKSGDSLTDCGTVMGESTKAVVFDALNPEEQQLSMITGITGQVHSAAYDFGITWISGQGNPTVMDDELGGMSVLAEGTATKDASSFDFKFEIAITPHHEGVSTVSGISAEGNCDSSTQKLVIHTDPQEWFRYVNFGALANNEENPVILKEGTSVYNSFYMGLASGSIIDFEWF